MPSNLERTAATPSARSLAYRMASRTVCTDDLRPPTGVRLRACSFGLAWVARRELLDAHGFYDRLIIGSGDRAMACAAFGRFEDAIHTTRLDIGRSRHYRRWAEPYFDAVQGRVGWLDGALFHLWHGDIRDRHYVERHEQLSKFDFDPERDIALDDNGAWRWSSDKIGLHEFVSAYFGDRREDGGPAPPPAQAGHISRSAGSTPGKRAADGPSARANG
jgi:hypothetical protein